MRFELLFLGKTREKYLAAGIDDYGTRLSRYIPTDIRVLKEKKGRKGEPDHLQIDRDSDILRQNAAGSFLVCLHPGGSMMNSPQLAARVADWEMQGEKKITFVIGGHLGLSAELLAEADLVLSLSPMTFTHEMSRLLLLEQLYRACTIKAGEKYHK